MEMLAENAKVITTRQLYEVAETLINALLIEMQATFKHSYKQCFGVLWTDTADKGEILMDSQSGKALKQKGMLGSPIKKHLILSGQLGEWDILMLSEVLEVISKDWESSGATEKLKSIIEKVHNRPKKEMDLEEHTVFGLSLREFLKAVKIPESKLADVLTQFLNEKLPTSEEGVTFHIWLLAATAYDAAKNYAKAAESLTHLLQVSAKIAADMKLGVLKFRLKILQKMLKKSKSGKMEMYDDETTLDAVQNALDIIKLDGTYSAAHLLLITYFETKEEPYRALRHASRHMSSHLQPFFGGLKHVVEALADKMRHDDPAHQLLLQGSTCCKNVMDSVTVGMMPEKNIENMGMNIVNAVEMFKKAFQVSPTPTTQFAVSAAVIIFYGDYLLNDWNLADVDVYIQHLRKIAKDATPSASFGDGESHTESLRVGLAQTLLGVLYETGCYMERNYQEAEKWFKKACVEHNFAPAAFNLAQIYNEGPEGCSRNVPLAKFYMKQAAQGAHPPALFNLAVMNLYQAQLVTARLHIKIALKYPDNSLETLHRYKDLFLNQFINATALGWDDKVEFLDKIIAKEFEEPFNLSKKGLSILERAKRAELFGFRHTVHDLLEAVELFFRMTTPNVVPDRKKKMDTEIMDEFDSKMALINKTFLKTYDLLIGNKNADLNLAEEICKLLFNCFKLSPSIKSALQLCSYYDDETRGKIAALMKQLMEAKNDKEAVLLYYIFRRDMGSNTFPSVNATRHEAIRTIREHLGLVPNSSLFYMWICEFYDKDNVFAVEEMEGMSLRAIQKFPKKYVFWYFLAATQFQLFSKGIDEFKGRPADKMYGGRGGRQIKVKTLASAFKAIDCYHEFLKQAPPKHPLYPIAAYSLASTFISIQAFAYLFQSPPKINVEDVVTNYKRGLEAESVQLPCFPTGMAVQYLKYRVQVYLHRTGNLSNDEVSQFREKDCGYLFSRLYLASPLRVYSTRRLRLQLKKTTFVPSSQSQSATLIAYKTMSWDQFCFKFANPTTLAYEMVIDGSIPPFGTTSAVGGHLKLTIIDDVYFGSPIAYFLAEDHEGSVIHVGVSRGTAIYANDSKLTLEFGTKLVIFNPHLIVEDNHDDRYIRVALDISCQMILVGKVNDMCRFCGNENSSISCGTCGRRYCTENCKVKDCRVLKHDYICTADESGMEILE